MELNTIIERLKTDKDFLEKYAALNGMDAILEQAKKDGYDVTRKDVETVLHEMGLKIGELTDDELAAVAGGSGFMKLPGKLPREEIRFYPDFHKIHDTYA